MIDFVGANRKIRFLASQNIVDDVFGCVGKYHKDGSVNLVIKDQFPIACF